MGFCTKKYVIRKKQIIFPQWFLLKNLRHLIGLKVSKESNLEDCIRNVRYFKDRLQKNVII